MSAAGDPHAPDTTHACTHENTSPLEGLRLVLRDIAGGQDRLYRVTLCQDCGVLQGVAEPSA